MNTEDKNDFERAIESGEISLADAESLVLGVVKVSDHKTYEAFQKLFAKLVTEMNEASSDLPLILMSRITRELHKAMVDCARKHPLISGCLAIYNSDGDHIAGPDKVSRERARDICAATKGTVVVDMTEMKMN